MTYDPVRAVAEVIAGLWDDPVPARCGATACGGANLGVGTAWPIDLDTAAWCGSAVCGLARCGRIVPNGGIFAGLIPPKLSHRVTLALTVAGGGPADPRQVYATAYDNPAYELHVIGDDLQWLDTVAGTVQAALDRTAHLGTSWGTINTLAVGPPSRTIRRQRPRYDVTLTINAEMERNT